MDWQYALKRGSYLYSQLSAYPMPNPVYPLPFSPDGAVRDYLQRLATDELGKSDTILYVGRPDDPITAWLREFLESDGYEGTVALKQRLTLIVFRKQHPASH
jgi:hypothetical protein